MNLVFFVLNFNIFHKSIDYYSDISDVIITSAKIGRLHEVFPVLITYTLFISPFFAAIECLKGFSIIYTYSEHIINNISSIYLKISRTFWTFADLGLLGTFWESVRDFLSDSPLVQDGRRI